MHNSIIVNYRNTQDLSDFENLKMPPGSSVHPIQMPAMEKNQWQILMFQKIHEFE